MLLEKYKLFGASGLTFNHYEGYNYKMTGEQEKEVEIEFIYLPTYSPNLNLIERLWKYAKKKLLSVYHETTAQ